jgi:hypothetical protein
VSAADRDLLPLPGCRGRTSLHPTGTRRHPGHVDHVMDTALKAALDGGVSPLGLGGPVLEVDTSSPVNVAAVARWVTQQPEWHLPTPFPPTPNQHRGG